MGYSKESGFTLIELLVVVGIVGVLSTAAALTFNVVMKISPSAMEQNSELSQVHLAGSWIARDMKNAYTFTPGPPDLCSMTCREGASFDNYTITYSIADNALMRTRLKLDPVGEPETAIVARHIDAANTGFIPADSSGNYYKLTVTADSNPSNAEGVTRIYKLKWGY